MLGSPLDKLVVLAIITSALSSTQTTILPASRTTLSMARQGAFPKAFGRVHPRFLTPHVSTITIGVVAAVWFGVLFPLSENFVYDSLTALSLMIAFYYALNGFACAIYYRRELTKSVKNFLFIGVGPVVGGLILGFLFVKAIIEYSKTDAELLGQRAVRRRHPGGARDRPAAARRGADADLAPRGAPSSSSAASARSWTRTLRPASSSASRPSRRRRSDGRRSCWATTPRPGAERALETAIELASQFGDRLLIAFGVQPPGPPTGEGAEHRARAPRSRARG